MEHPYQHYFEAMPCYLTVQNREFKLLEANARFREDFGAAAGRHCFEVYKRRTEKCADCPVELSFEDGKVHQCEEALLNRYGEQVIVLVHAAPIRDAEGRIEAVLEMSADITQIHELRTQFASMGMLISTISHGIKGLLTGLDGGLYLVDTGLAKNKPERLDQGWKMVKRNLQRIRSLVLDILYYAKDREPHWEWVAAAAVAEEVCGMIQPRVAEQRVELRRQFDPPAGEFEADPKALHSLLINLIENALDACRVDKKNSAHFIAVAVRGFPEHLEFEVQDNGIGMDDESREKAFNLFYSSKGAEGTGLGLFISNKIAKAHGGSIVLESKIDQGTRVTVKLPRRRPYSPPA
jgi:PAS domain S-box-containing protein